MDLETGIKLIVLIITIALAFYAVCKLGEDLDDL